MKLLHSQQTELRPNFVLKSVKWGLHSQSHGGRGGRRYLQAAEAGSEVSIWGGFFFFCFVILGTLIRPAIQKNHWTTSQIKVLICSPILTMYLKPCGCTDIEEREKETCFVGVKLNYFQKL